MKKKAGQNSVNNIKTSKFLPKVFQTELNKNWLDSTLDQMVSKGPLEDLNGYIGSRTGKDALSTDTYLEPKFHKALRTKNQLQPGVISYDNSDNVTNMITFDDVAHSINENFATYNYNAAYASSLYSFNPPVDIDKLVNYRNYRWVEELPVYESIWTGTAHNSVILAETTSVITDDNNTVNIEEGMLIKFTGSGQHVNTRNKTYIVTGATNHHKLRLYFVANGDRRYNNLVKHTTPSNGIWVNDVLFSAEANENSSYWNNSGTQTPQDLITLFNNDATRLPIFDGFNFPNHSSNPTQLINNMLVTLWPETAATAIVVGQKYKIKTIGTTDFTLVGATNGTKGQVFTATGVATGTGTVTSEIVYSLKIDSTTGKVSMFTATAAEELTIPIMSPPSGVTLMYNDGEVVEPIKDYIVVAKNDAYQSAWSRTNHWVNISTINKLRTLLPTYNFTEILNATRQAMRPIIEYTAGMDMWNNAKYTDRLSASALYLGAVDYGIKINAQGAANFPEGTRYVFIDNAYTKIYTRGAAGTAVANDTSVALVTNNTFNILSSLDSSWVNADVYFDGTKINKAQQKLTINQYPQYRFYNQIGTPLENVEGIAFQGEVISVSYTHLTLPTIYSV